MEGMPTCFDHFREHAKKPDSFMPWSHAKGLRNKIFWLHEESNTTGGLYTFTSRYAIDEYMKTDLFASMNQIPFLCNVKFEVHENLGGGELCADLGVWPASKGNGPVTAEDLKDAWMLEPRFHIKPEVCPLDNFRGMLAGGATAPWADLPGLRNKYFTLYGD
jgi:hypothetical protein